jgi:hypothetical protein
MPDNTAGYLALEIKVDDSNVAGQIAEAQANAQSQLNRLSSSKLPNFAAALKQDAVSATGQIKIISAAAQEAHQRFGVMANAVTGASTAVRLLGLESGYAVVETGRLVLYLGRATTAAGGLAAGIGIVAAAVKGFLVTIGAIGWAVLGAATAYAAATSAIKKMVAATDELNKAKEKELELTAKELQGNKDVLKTLTEARDRLAVSRGEMSPQIAEQRQLERAGNPFAEQIASANALARANDVLQKNLERNKQEYSDLLEQQRKERRDWAREDHDLEMQYFADRDLAQLTARRADRDAIVDAKIRLGILKESAAFPIGSVQGRLADFFQDRKKSLDALKENQGFGIGTLPAEGFRFGFGAMGSVIGEQSEQKNTTQAVKDLEKTFERLFTAEFGGAGGAPISTFDLMGFTG